MSLAEQPLDAPSRLPTPASAAPVLAAPASSANLDDVPLVVDLDGTLLRTDSLHETFLDALRCDPAALWRLPMKLIAGPSAVKAFLAGKSPLAVETWPVNEEFLAYVRQQAERGRRIVLATAADRAVADAVAARFPFISEVIASDGATNLKGAAKAEALRARFPGGFIYAGDSRADLAVWREASGSVLVNASPGVVRAAGRDGEPLAVFARRPPSFTLIRRSLRLHQWAKNLLVFIPLLLGGKAGDLAAWFDTTLGFLALGLVASATYIINDLWDLPNDRRHWSKCDRPLASGELPISTGALWAAAALAAGFGLAATLGLAVVVMLALYVAVTLSYSLSLKRVPILDVLVLAGLFTLRLEYGIVLAVVRVSPWLLVFSMFVFVSLSMAKRHAEVMRLAEKGIASINGRGYLPGDAPLTLGLGLSSMLGALLIMVLYLIEDAFPRGFYARPVFLWALPPILFLFLGRIWMLCQRGQLNDDPVEFAVKDRVSVVLGVAMAVSFLLALIGIV